MWGEAKKERARRAVPPTGKDYLTLEMKVESRRANEDERAGRVA
jgi:hypothetical protein